MCSPGSTASLNLGEMLGQWQKFQGNVKVDI